MEQARESWRVSSEDIQRDYGGDLGKFVEGTTEDTSSLNYFDEALNQINPVYFVILVVLLLILLTMRLLHSRSTK